MAEDTSNGAESAELRALREAEQELFPQTGSAGGTSPWPSDLGLGLSGQDGPRVEASGLPPHVSLAPPAGDGAVDLAWLARLELPDIPVRWDEHVLRYLGYFKDDPRGRTTFTNLYRHSGRFRDMMRRALRRKSLPEDLVWVAMIESAFDPVARSVAGAAGLWQFMPETARIYGLVVDRWVDQRYSATLSTDAAADFLADLHRRFGSWELAIAGYNMGYAGLVSIVRRYNTNDFWSLVHTEGTLPWETTLYVPKIIACAVVAHNLAAFGLSDIVVDPPVEPDEVNVPPGTPLALVGQALGCAPREVEGYNPELRAARTPPSAGGDAPYKVKVPRGKGSLAAQALARLRGNQPALDRYVVRFGESLDQIAAQHRTTTQHLIDLNAIAPGEALRGGTVLLVPHVEVPAVGASASSGPASAPASSLASAPPQSARPVGSSEATASKQSVVVPPDLFVYPDRKRVFYRVLIGDTLKDIAAALHVTADDLRRWNALDASARLAEGMTLQCFVPETADLSKVVVLSEADVRVLPVGSDEFYASLEHDRNMKRVLVTARDGDTLASIGRRYGIAPRVMERINRRGSREALSPGETVVLYVPSTVTAPTATGTATAANEALPNGPLPDAPLPDLLP
jgi:membrane-bound lytic murein transglycosylase D